MTPWHWEEEEGTMSASPSLTDPCGTLGAMQALCPGRGSCEEAITLDRGEEEQSGGRKPRVHRPGLSSWFKGSSHCWGEAGWGREWWWGAALAKNEAASKPDQRLNLALAAAVCPTTVPPPSFFSPLFPPGSEEPVLTLAEEEQNHPPTRSQAGNWLSW